MKMGIELFLDKTSGVNIPQILHRPPNTEMSRDHCWKDYMKTTAIHAKCTNCGGARLAKYQLFPKPLEHLHNNNPKNK